MSKIACRRSRTRCILLALGALAVVVVFVAADTHFRWSGLRRDGFWSAGILLYALLLGAASGPTIDYRERPRRADAPGSGEPARASARLGP